MNKPTHPTDSAPADDPMAARGEQCLWKLCFLLRGGRWKLLLSRFYLPDVSGGAYENISACCQLAGQLVAIYLFDREDHVQTMDLKICMLIFKLLEPSTLLS